MTKAEVGLEAAVAQIASRAAGTPQDFWLLAPTRHQERAHEAIDRFEDVWGLSLESREFRSRLTDAEFFRFGQAGHMTASAMVVAEDGRFLLTLHERFKTWQQLGGHADGEQNPMSVALRESYEESGLAELALVTWPIDLDVHQVDCPQKTPTRHFDLCFVAFVRGRQREHRSEESDSLRWFDLEAAASIGVSSRVLRLAKSAVGLRGLVPPPWNGAGY
jgi:8-oxo-dGTP pyrophosphatase MutT (NUDIX family)